MKKHITAAIVGVTAAVLVVLGVPLAIVARGAIIRSEVLQLQRDAMRTVADVGIPLDPNELAEMDEESGADDVTHFGVYDLDGRKIFGVGPEVADAVTRRALVNGSASSSSRHPVVADAVVGDDEKAVGAVRLAGSSAKIDRRVVLAIVVIAGAMVAALVGSWLVARRLAERLARPLVGLAAVGEQLARGETWTPQEPSGVAEIDDLAAALHHGASRVVESLARERRFSQDVSHQLRTPITSLRLLLESRLHTAVDDDTRAAALDDLTRLEVTVTDLLRSARGTTPAPTAIDVEAVLDGVERRWSRRVAAEGRSLSVSIPRGAQALATASLLEQVLDVLVHNALRHGRGRVTCAGRLLAGGVAIEVADEGSLDPALTEDVLFRRGEGKDHGIGLALARDLAEADGGRLLLGSRTPTTFTVMLLGAE